MRIGSCSKWRYVTRCLVYVSMSLLATIAFCYSVKVQIIPDCILCVLYVCAERERAKKEERERER